MKALGTVAFALIMVAILVGCGQQSPTTTEPEPAAEHMAPMADVSAPEMVEVTAEGNTFDPPVAKEQIPDGAWFCDMETVHYARAEEGDGLCPVCGMKLVQKVAPVEPVPDAMTEEPMTEESHDS
jgi:hypothetical protein